MMFPYLVLSAAIGALVALCVQRLIPRATPPSLMPSETHRFSALGVDMSGRGGIGVEAHHARLLRPILEKLGNGWRVM
jgi:hypothetical protein